MTYKKITPKTYFTVAGVIAIFAGFYIAGVVISNRNKPVIETPIENFASSTIQTEIVATTTTNQATTTKVTIINRSSSYVIKTKVQPAKTLNQIYGIYPKEGEKIVFYTDKGFLPQTTEIAPGETVRFVNESNKEMWVSAKNFAITYPYYKNLPYLDEGGFVEKGGQYSYTFGGTGDFSYFNKLYPFDGGFVKVRER